MGITGARPVSGQNRIFDAIRRDDLAQVRAILAEAPSAVNAIAPKRPPERRAFLFPGGCFFLPKTV